MGAASTTLYSLDHWETVHGDRRGKEIVDHIVKSTLYISFDIDHKRIFLLFEHGVGSDTLGRFRRKMRWRHGEGPSERNLLCYHKTVTQFVEHLTLQSGLWEFAGDLFELCTPFKCFSLSLMNTELN